MENAFLKLSDELSRGSVLIESIKWGGRIVRRPTWLVNWNGFPLYFTMSELSTLTFETKVGEKSAP